jgi:toxin ParE1/3/4
MSKSLQLNQVEYSKRALSDLESIWAYIAADSETQANKLMIGFAKKFKSLLNFPQLGKARNDLIVGLRSFPNGKYLVFYQETENGIEIVRVIHGARDIEQTFEEMIPEK